jgi:hypothetical protein
MGGVWINDATAINQVYLSDGKVDLTGSQEIIHTKVVDCMRAIATVPFRVPSCDCSLGARLAVERPSSRHIANLRLVLLILLAPFHFFFNFGQYVGQIG